MRNKIYATVLSLKFGAVDSFKTNKFFLLILFSEVNADGSRDIEVEKPRVITAKSGCMYYFL